MPLLVHNGQIQRSGTAAVCLLEGMGKPRRSHQTHLKFWSLPLPAGVWCLRGKVNEAFVVDRGLVIAIARDTYKDPWPQRTATCPARQSALPLNRQYSECDDASTDHPIHPGSLNRAPPASPFTRSVHAPDHAKTCMCHVVWG